MKLSNISALVITYNEEPNIRRVLSKLRRLRNVIVVDSGSDDETISIVNEFENTTVCHRLFDNFAEQCNFGLSKVKTDWVLSLDADYVLSDGLINEIQDLNTIDDVNGYYAAFRYCIYGKPLSASLYPPRCVLYKRDNAVYQNEGHGHRVRVEGSVQSLKGIIYHDDRKPLSRWLESQNVYAKNEAEYLEAWNGEEMDRGDRLRRLIWAAPIVIFLYVFIWKGCFLEGWRGWYYVLQRTYAEILVSLHMLENKYKGILK